MRESGRYKALMLAVSLLASIAVLGAHTAVHADDLNPCPICLHHELQGHAIAAAWSAPALLSPATASHPRLAERPADAPLILGFNARASP